MDDATCMDRRVMPEKRVKSTNDENIMFSDCKMILTKKRVFTCRHKMRTYFRDFKIDEIDPLRSEHYVFFFWKRNTHQKRLRLIEYIE